MLADRPVCYGHGVRTTIESRGVGFVFERSLEQLRRGDVIISINGTKTSTIPQLQEQVARFRPGKSIEVDYIRKGKKHTATVILKNRSNNTLLMGVRDESILQDLGVELRDLSKSERRRLDINTGVMVKSIIRGSKIERTNMDPGFIITKVNETEISSVEEIIQELKKTKGKILLEGVYENYPGEWGYTFTR